MDPVKLVDLSLEKQIDAVSQAFEKMPSGAVLRLSCLEEYVAGFSLERAFIAWTAERAGEIVKACALLDVYLETAMVEANGGFFYVRVSSDDDGDLIYQQCPLASVLALLKGHLAEAEYVRAIQWLESDESECFESPDHAILAS
jgi:hypothetical protein